MRKSLIAGILWITIFLEPLFHWYTIRTYGLSLSTLKTGGFDFALMKPITLEELSSPGCHNCKAFEEFWRSIEKDWPNISYKNMSIMTSEGQEIAQKYMIFASPGIIINGELWATGGFDKEKFITHITELSK